MQLYKTLFFAARQGQGATEVQAASAALAIHYLQVADQVPRAAPTMTAPHSFSMPAGILTGPLKPVSNCERLHLSPPRPSRQQPSRDADGTNPLGRLVEEKEDSGTGNPLVSSESACALSTLRVYVTIRAACRPAPGFAGRHVGSWRE